ncbi:hypothetical protein PANDA_014613 [Ailuropoda melanoleuca]|uniref:Uncharacterized protein n=1 Tax=Ailuropoda melanoleuca TaxID=9646 RepID=D2HRJ1_AILME|nr:hypothetical protein PANDA_014613 [Ailuropoda melanoleuca]
MNLVAVLQREWEETVGDCSDSKGLKYGSHSAVGMEWRGRFDGLVFSVLFQDLLCPGTLVIVALTQQVSHPQLPIQGGAGLRPKRTLRLVLWTAEEQGGIGGFQYYQSHKASPSQHPLQKPSSSGPIAENALVN